VNGSSLVCDAGTLQGFAFDSDEELERPAVEKAGSPEQMKHEEGGDDGKETKKKKVPAKAPVCARTSSGFMFSCPNRSAKDVNRPKSCIVQDVLYVNFP
jgi:hypothetical protein